MSDRKEKNNLLDYLKIFWKEGQVGGRKKNYFLLSLLLLGIILMFTSSFFAPQKKLPSYSSIPADKVQESPVSGDTYEKDLLRSLQQVLENIDGISQVHVFISYDSGKESFYARVNEESNRQTTERDREGGTREIFETNSKEDYVLLREAGGGEKPLLLSENMPRVSGILVVARGVENSLLRLKVVRAIQSVLKLPVHRIAVLPLGDNKNR
ncbi:MAG: hypothetical protein C4554_03275 [Dethiobacter sp.]|nr:MAG: hypothetical protein C4554_03275 [Dethiobacter sp.]